MNSRPGASAGSPPGWLQAADAMSAWSGRAVAWLTLAMVLVTFLVVVLRYFFSLGWIWMQELGAWFHALVFLLAAAYTLKHDEHVRVDLFYRRMTPRRRALVDLLGTLFLLLPTCAFILWVSFPYVAESWVRSEASRETGGLPFPFIPLAKSAIPVTCALLALEGLALGTRAWLVLRGRIAPTPPGEGSQEL